MIKNITWKFDLQTLNIQIFSFMLFDLSDLCIKGLSE